MTDGTDGTDGGDGTGPGGTPSAGERVFRTLAPTGAEPPWGALTGFAPGLGAEVERALGAVLGRPQLDLRTRQLVTVGILAALGGCEPQLEFHIGGALRVGARPAEVVEALTQVTLYAGFPRTLNAVQVARKVFAEHGVPEGDPGES